MGDMAVASASPQRRGEVVGEVVLLRHVDWITVLSRGGGGGGVGGWGEGSDPLVYPGVCCLPSCGSDPLVYPGVCCLPSCGSDPLVYPGVCCLPSCCSRCRGHQLRGVHCSLCVASFHVLRSGWV